MLKACLWLLHDLGHYLMAFLFVYKVITGIFQIFLSLYFEIGLAVLVGS